MLNFVKRLLQVCNVLNWVGGAFALVLLAMLLAVPDVFEDSLAQEFGSGGGQVAAITSYLIAACSITIIVVPAVHFAFTRITRLIDRAKDGTVFASESVRNLQVVAWAVLAINVADLIFGIISVRVSEKTGEYLGWAPTLTGWFAALLLFVLARIFRDGARMQEDLEGTV